MAGAAPVARGIFRAYDIRGIVGQGLDAHSVRLIGQAIGSEARERGERTLIAGADARLSSPELSQALQAGILASGCDVIDLGVVPTPLMYFATHTLAPHSGVMLTGSHNPRDYNGIKVVLQRRPLADQQITRLYERIVDGELATGKGTRTTHDIAPSYLARVTSDIRLAKRLRVALDCGNGVTGIIAPQLFERLGCDVLRLYCEPDGNFPNHHPDPTRPENLRALKQLVYEKGADIGIAFDGDGDRLGLVTGDGNVVDADHMLLAFAMDVLPDNPGARVVYDIKSSHHLARVVSALGGSGVLCKSGHSFVKNKLLETDALLGGEFSAHLFFRHRWYGFDDGMYAAARFLELMDKYDASAQDILERMPPGCSTPELFIPVAEQDKFALMERLVQELRFDGGNVNYLDGIRVDLAQGWGLIRPSNTTPNLVLRFEADSAEDLARIQQEFRTKLAPLMPGLALPF
ncbi:MAG TPA: phosphomannomutase/phosphoglucomutase [Pseudomonadales bacterium]